jgi:hypothetical protein
MNQASRPAGALVILGCVLIGMAWLLPGHYFPWLAFQQEFAAAVGTGLLGLAALSVPRARWPALASVALATAVVPLLQFAAGKIGFITDAGLAAAYIAAFALCIAVGATLGGENDDLAEGLTAAVVIAAFVSCAMALTQWLRLDAPFVEPLRPGARPYANIAQPNLLSTLLLLGICGVLRWFEARRLGALTALLAVAFLGFGVVMTQSRTGWLVAVIGAAWLLWGARRAALRVSPWAVLSALTTFALMTAWWSSINEAMLLSSSGVREGHLTPGTRPLHWAAMWDAALRQPWTGYGWTQATLAQQLVALDHPYSGEQITHSHNLVLDLLVWNGIPLGAVIVAVFGWWLLRQMRLATSAGHAIGLLAVIVLLTHAMLEYPLDYAFFLLPLGLLVGLLHKQSAAPGELRPPRWALAVSLVALLALLGRVGVEYIRTEEAARTLRFVVLGIGVDKVASAPEPDVWLLDRPRAFHRYMLSQPQADLSHEDLAWIRQVAQRHAFPSSLFRLALVFGINGQHEEAARTLAVLCKIHPRSTCADVRTEWQAIATRYPQVRDISPPELEHEAATSAANPVPREKAL